MNILIGSGKSVHAPAAADGPESKMARCGAGLSRGVRGHSAWSVTPNDVTCKNCLKLLAHDAVQAELLAESMAELQHNEIVGADRADQPHAFVGPYQACSVYGCDLTLSAAVHKPAVQPYGHANLRAALEEVRSILKNLASRPVEDLPFALKDALKRYGL